MSKKLISRFSTTLSNKYSEVFFDAEFGSYICYFYFEDGFISHTESFPDISVRRVEEVALKWLKDVVNNFNDIHCERFDYLIAQTKTQAVHYRKVLKL